MAYEKHPDEMGDYPLDLCGLNFGTHDGWDQHDTMAFEFYNFVPVASIASLFPAKCDLYVNFENGVYQAHDDNATVQAEGNLADLFTSGRLPRAATDAASS